VAASRAYYTVWLTLKDSDTVDEFYKYRGQELPEVGEVIEVVRFLRDRPTRARVTRVDVDFKVVPTNGGNAKNEPRISATQIVD
jgi:hypothetical protein